MFRQTMAVAIMVAVAGSALAGTPVFNARQQAERARIAEGARSGELTRPETARLVAGQVHLQRVENRVKSDGVVTPAERARLQQAANVQSRHIYRQKHDNQVRP